MSIGPMDAFATGEGIPVALTDVETELSRLWEEATDHTTGSHQLFQRTAERRRESGRRLIGEQKQLLEIFELAGPRLTGQLPGTFGWRFGLQERQFVDNVRMHTLSDTQGLLSQRKRQSFSAGPNQETNSMGSHGGQSETKNSDEGMGQC